MFDRCCDCRSAKDYPLVHDPIPLPLQADKDTIIKDLLWYVPNIDSFQAPKNELIQDKLYDDFSFTFILNRMGMIEDRDVKWLSCHDSFDEDDWSYFENRICCNCQKIIITRCESLSKTNDFLRALRNCIAHGHFAFVDDFLIGFNQQTRRAAPPIKKAVIKIRPKLLLEALRALTSPQGKELLIGYAFERLGYTIFRQLNSSYKLDYLVEKNGKKYAIEVKDYKGHAYLHPDSITTFLRFSGDIHPEAKRVLFIDTSRVTKAVRELEKKIENFRIIDLTEVKKMISTPPVDVLAENEDA